MNKYSNPEESPLYEHDCDVCKFLGVFENQDLYFCKQMGRIPTLICRYSSDGPDYSSGLMFTGSISGLGEAAKRAMNAGLLTESEISKYL